MIRKVHETTSEMIPNTIKVFMAVQWVGHFFAFLVQTNLLCYKNWYPPEAPCCLFSLHFFFFHQFPSPYKLVTFKANCAVIRGGHTSPWARRNSELCECTIQMCTFLWNGFGSVNWNNYQKAQKWRTSECFQKHVVSLSKELFKYTSDSEQLLLEGS